MDRLADLLAAADPLLVRVEAVLTAAGAPADHDLWAELRKVRLLPRDAVHAVAGLAPDAFGDTAIDLRIDARACVDVADSLPEPGTWTGDAADAYADARRRAAEHLSGGDESLDERLQATADLAQALGDWMTQTRTTVAAALADVLTSREAATLTADPNPASPQPSTIHAAADLAAHLLHAVADSYDEATDLLRASNDLTVAIPI